MKKKETKKNRKRPQVVADVVRMIDSCKTDAQITNLKKFIENVCERKMDDASYIMKCYISKEKEIKYKN